MQNRVAVFINDGIGRIQNNVSFIIQLDVAVCIRHRLIDLYGLITEIKPGRRFGIGEMIAVCIQHGLAAITNHGLAGKMSERASVGIGYRIAFFVIHLLTAEVPNDFTGKMQHHIPGHVYEGISCRMKNRVTRCVSDDLSGKRVEHNVTGLIYSTGIWIDLRIIRIKEGLKGYGMYFLFSAEVVFDITGKFINRLAHTMKNGIAVFIPDGRCIVQYHVSVAVRHDIEFGINNGLTGL